MNHEPVTEQADQASRSRHRITRGQRRPASDAQLRLLPRRILLILLALAGTLVVTASAQATLQFNSCPTGDDFTVTAVPGHANQGYNPGALSVTIDQNSTHATWYAPYSSSHQAEVCGAIIYDSGRSQPYEQGGQNGGQYLAVGTITKVVVIGEWANFTNPAPGQSCSSQLTKDWDNGSAPSGDSHILLSLNPADGMSPATAFSIHPATGWWLCPSSYVVPSRNNGSNEIVNAQGMDWPTNDSSYQSGETVSEVHAAAELAPVPRNTLSVPATPGTPTATAGNGSATLQWPANTESDLAGYRVYNGTQLVKTVVAPAHSATLTGLTNGHSYRFTVAAYDVDGNQSAKSSPSNAVTPQAPRPLTLSFVKLTSSLALKTLKQNGVVSGDVKLSGPISGDCPCKANASVALTSHPGVTSQVKLSGASGTFRLVLTKTLRGDLKHGTTLHLAVLGSDKHRRKFGFSRTLTVH